MNTRPGASRKPSQAILGLACIGVDFALPAAPAELRSSAPPSPPGGPPRPLISYVVPPLGLKPRRFWLEERQTEVLNAIARRVGTGFMVPEEWIVELMIITVEINEIIEEANSKLNFQASAALGEMIQ